MFRRGTLAFQIGRRKSDIQLARQAERRADQRDGALLDAIQRRSGRAAGLRQMHACEPCAALLRQLRERAARTETHG
jgi:hypothetical protein